VVLLSVTLMMTESTESDDEVAVTVISMDDIHHGQALRQLEVLLLVVATTVS